MNFISRRRFIGSAAAGGALAIRPAKAAATLPDPAPMPSKDLDFDKWAPLQMSHLPTPLEPLPALTAALGGPTLLVKRDDQTGLAFGGNKGRKLDFILADTKRQQAGVIITSAGVQSNWARSVAAGARKLGMRAVLVLSKSEVQPAAGGNLWLDRILDADVRFVEIGQNQREALNAVVAQEKEKGHRPYVVSVGGSRTGGSMAEPLGAIAYARAYQEIHAQAAAMKARVTHIIMTTGSGSTQAGLVVGAKALAPGVKIIGIRHSPDSRESAQRTVAEIANQTAKAMSLEFEFAPEDIIVFDEYGGKGYGVMTAEVADAVATMARLEGLMLDPVYTAKAMAGLTDLVKKGHFQRDDVVVLLHTGGTPNLFIYEEEMQKLFGAARPGNQP